jgi:hypothetical protein
MPRDCCSLLVLAVLLFCESAAADSRAALGPNAAAVEVWIESPKQNEKVYYYQSQNPTFSAVIRLRRAPVAALSSLALNVFFQGSLVAEVAADNDVVNAPAIALQRWHSSGVSTPSRFHSHSPHSTSMPRSRCRPPAGGRAAAHQIYLRQVQAVDASSGSPVSEVFGVDFSVKMSKRFVWVHIHRS